MFKQLFFLCLLFNCGTGSMAQLRAIDSVKNFTHTGVVDQRKSNEQTFSAGNGETFIYPKPGSFGFITRLPRDATGIIIAPFQKHALKPLLFLAGLTGLLMLSDETVTENVHRLSDKIHLQRAESYKDVLVIKAGKTNISLLKVPQNINSGFYEIGQGFPSLLIGAGLFTWGKINHNYRAISTASQLAESFILMGAGTQLLKRITGRQSPSETVDLEGRWHPFPSFKNFQKHTPFYDAFPSGHLATLMSTVTVLTENYPEFKWIKPVGYSVTGLVGYCMLNNNVHWLSDYPLAIALGYLCAKQVAKNSRRVVATSSKLKSRGSLSYTFNYVYGRFVPALIYKFN